MNLKDHTNTLLKCYVLDSSGNIHMDDNEKEQKSKRNNRCNAVKDDGRNLFVLNRNNN